MYTEHTDIQIRNPESRMAIHLTMPLYVIKGGQPASSLSVVNYKRELNRQKFGMAFQNNSLLGLRTMETDPVTAVRTMGELFEKQKDIAFDNGLETRQSADLIGTNKVGKMFLRFAAPDAELGCLQARVAQQIAPIATVMFFNRIDDQARETPVYSAQQTSSKVTEISVDKPCDPLRVAAYFVGIMGDERRCRRTLNLLKAHQGNLDCASLLFQASKKDIANALPENDRNTVGLETSARMTRLSSKQQTIYI